MADPEILDLVNRGIDGVLSDAEHDRLETLRAEHTDVDALYRELTAVATMLDEAAVVKPPADLKARILHALPADRYKPPERHPAGGILDILRRAFQRKPALALAYTFAMGLVVGVAVLAFLTRSGGIDEAGLYGSLVAQEVPEAFATTDEQTIRLDEVQGVLRVRQADEIVLIELEATAPDGVAFVWAFDPGAFTFRGYSTLHDAAGGQVTTGADYVRLSDIGAGRYLLAFKRTTSSQTPIDFQIVRSGEVLDERVLSTGA